MTLPQKRGWPKPYIVLFGALPCAGGSLWQHINWRLCDDASPLWFSGRACFARFWLLALLHTIDAIVFPSRRSLNRYRLHAWRHTQHSEPDLGKNVQKCNKPCATSFSFLCECAQHSFVLLHLLDQVLCSAPGHSWNFGPFRDHVSRCPLA